MKFIIRGQRVEVTDSIKNYIEEKIGRLEKHFNAPEDITATVVIRIRDNSQIVEVTIPANKTILRSEESHKDLYASIDLVSDKLERQIRKNKTKMQGKKIKPVFEDFTFDIAETPIEENKSTIVKRKQLDTKPMSEEEAVLQMELLDHDFYIFKNAKTDNISVVYKRKAGDYGIIDTK
ncbi:MAG TPA: ribosome-associated translation inhibitor RaiA [Bacilli bacterium]|nr:ribosome-associated translation inhibitor RaiA [Bacilli bacterium]